MRDISGSLARQAALVAAVCLVVDVGSLLLTGYVAIGHWQVWVVLAAIALADAGLAGPAHLSGVVAVGHSVLRIAAPLLVAPLHIVTEATRAGTLIAGYRAGAWLRTGPATVAMVALVVGTVTGEALIGGPKGFDWRALGIQGLIDGVLPWLVGRHTTARRAHIAELEQRAERQRSDQRAAVRRAVLEERGAIARDLHDVISHHVSAIGVHAGAARLGLAALPGTDVPGTAPPEAASPGAARLDAGPYRSLAAVESSSRAAMADLRRLLDLLHGKDSDVRQPGLDNVDELLEGVREAGMAVTLRTTGTPEELPESLDVAVYRVIQEALTNALRHGAGAAEVGVDHRPGRLVLTVANALAAADAPPAWPRGRPHRGLGGIRKRVGLFGGELTYGPEPDGRRWLVVAAFPLPVSESAAQEAEQPTTKRVDQLPGQRANQSIDQSAGQSRGRTNGHAIDHIIAADEGGADSSRMGEQR